MSPKNVLTRFNLFTVVPLVNLHFNPAFIVLTLSNMKLLQMNAYLIFTNFFVDSLNTIAHSLIVWMIANQLFREYVNETYAAFFKISIISILL